MKEVKISRRRGYTRVSPKHQTTIPIDALRRPASRPGTSYGWRRPTRGGFVLVRADNLIARYAGCLPDVYPTGYLQELREEWR